MFLGTFQFAFTYVKGRGFQTKLPGWNELGWFQDVERAARLIGVELVTLNNEADRAWPDVWNEWKGHILRDEPVFVTFHNIESIWRGIGMKVRSDEGASNHNIVLIGFDEGRGVAICHDNHWWYGETENGQDLPIVEYQIEDLQRAFRDDPRSRKTPNFVFGGLNKDRLKLPLHELLQSLSEMMLGDRVHASFAPPPLDTGDFGYRALALAAADLRSVTSITQAETLLKGFQRFLSTHWWMGVDGQPPRAAWLAGVALATDNADIEEASLHVDTTASELARARDRNAEVMARLALSRVNFRDIAKGISDIAGAFQAASEAERRAGVALKRARI